MKRKIFSILFTLVLVLSLSLISAVPVMAAPTLYEHYNTGDDATTATMHSIYWEAQTFTAESYHVVTSVQLKLGKTGDPGTITVSIRATGGSGHPIGSDLTSGTTDGNTLPTADPWEWREITLTSYILTSGTKYAIVVRAPSGDASNGFRWRFDTAPGGYPGGNYEYSANSGSTWTSPADNDFMFEVHGPSPPIEVWVDDAWVGCTVGTGVDGHTCGITGFGTIQDGIDAVATGGTVNVADGTYNENVDVNKSVTLIGAGASSTIVQAAVSTDHVLFVTQPNVTITGFMLTGATNANQGGIMVDGGCGAHSCTISSNSASGNCYGIWLDNSNGSTISGNQVYSNLAEGIYLDQCTNCVIDGNIVHDNDVIHKGILLHDCSGIQVSNNEVYNEAYGIGLLGSDNNTILNNSIHDNGHGIFIDWGVGDISNNNKILGNSIVNNNETEDSGIHLTSGAQGTVINFNNIEGNSSTSGSYGVFNGNTSETVDATNNWWGASDGPSTSPGTGDKVSDHVACDPWLGAPLELPAAYHETLGPGEHEVDATDEADTKVTLTVTAEMSETDIYIARYASQPFPEEPFPDASLGKFIDIYLSNPDAVVWPIRVEVYYTYGEVAAAGIEETSLGLYYYMSPDTFHRCSDTGVDTTNNIIWANVTAAEASYLVGTPFGSGGSPPPPPPPIVGGTVYPVDKVSILMPWIGLAVALALAGVFITRFARRRVRG